VDQEPELEPRTVAVLAQRRAEEQAHIPFEVDPEQELAQRTAEEQE
jgi:hypothetical protein